MKVLVTGAAGFIASHLCESLLKQGHEVIGVDAFTPYYDPAIKHRNASAVTQAGGSLVEGDLCELDLTPLLTGVEAIYHSAAQPGICANTSFEMYLHNNLLATRRLAEAALACDSLQLFVNLSTSSVYGRHATDNEDTAPKPTSYYGVTKLAAEQLVLAFCRDKGFPACSLRLFSVYGPRERPEKLYPQLIRSILQGQAFPLYEGSREHSRSYTYIDDIIAGLGLVLEKRDACIGEIFNIGTDIVTTTGRGIEIVETILGASAQFSMKPPRPGDQLCTHANIEKARRILGYDPQTRPEDGLRKEVEWVQQEIAATA